MEVFNKDYKAVDAKSDIYTEKYFESLLNKYKDIFSTEVDDYLKKMVNGSISAVSEELNSKEGDNKEALRDFSIYRKIVIYNTYRRILSLVDRKKVKLSETSSDFRINNKVLTQNKLFDMNYQDTPFLINIYDCALVNNEVIDEEIQKQERLIKLFESEGFFDKYIYYYMSNLSIDERRKLLLPNSFSDDDLKEIEKKLNFKYEKILEVVRNNIRRKIFECKNRILTLRTLKQKKVSYDDEAKIEIMNYYNNLFMEEFGLSKEDMTIQETSEGSIEAFLDRKFLSINRTYTTSNPLLKVQNKIKYI